MTKLFDFILKDTYFENHKTFCLLTFGIYKYKSAIFSL